MSVYRTIDPTLVSFSGLVSGNIILDQWVHRHKKWVATGGNYVEKVNRTLDIDV